MTLSRITDRAGDIRPGAVPPRGTWVRTGPLRVCKLSSYGSSKMDSRDRTIARSTRDTAVILVLMLGTLTLAPSSARAEVDATQVAAGDAHTCALTPTGTADCWGLNGFRQANDKAGPFTQISAGTFHTCALTAAGAADCWGSNGYGQATDQAGPYTEISADGFHTCALTAAGAADCWGWNGYGQATDQAGPFTQISVGNFHTCALTAAGAADCWGLNGYDQAADKVGPYSDISAGNFHTCAITSPGGAADCWGLNDDGQATDQAGPFSQIAADGFHTCALAFPAGAADCWGLNDDGQATDQAGPFIQLSAGTFHTCAVTTAGTAICWGEDDFGQARLTSKLSMKVPSKVHEGDKAVISGRLTSNLACDVDPEEVSLRKDGKTLGTVSTSVSGAYEFMTKIGKKSVLQVIFPGTGPCDRDHSAKKMIKVA